MVRLLFSHGSIENVHFRVDIQCYCQSHQFWIVHCGILWSPMWIGLVDIRSNITWTDYNSSGVVYALWNKSLGGGVCVSGQGWPCVCAPTLTAAVYWLSSIHVSRDVWLNGTGLCTLGANGSVDKKSSLLPQIRRLNATSRASAAPRANGSENTTLWELWHNPPVTTEPQGNVWAKWLLFKSHHMSLAFKYIRVIQGLRVVLLTWYLNWKVNPAAGTADSKLKQSVVPREVNKTPKSSRQPANKHSNICTLHLCLGAPGN